MMFEVHQDPCAFRLLSRFQTASAVKTWGIHGCYYEVGML